MGHTPSTAGTFRKKFRRTSKKSSGNALRAFPGIPLESTAGIPQALKFKAFEGSKACSEFSPPQYSWGRLFFRSGSREGLSEPVMDSHGIPSSIGGISELINQCSCWSWGNIKPCLSILLFPNSTWRVQLNLKNKKLPLKTNSSHSTLPPLPLLTFSFVICNEWFLGLPEFPQRMQRLAGLLRTLRSLRESRRKRLAITSESLRNTLDLISCSKKCSDLRMQLLCLHLEASCYSGGFCLTVALGNFLTCNWSFYLQLNLLAYSGKVPPISTLMDCKQRSVAVSTKAPTVSKKTSPFLEVWHFMVWGASNWHVFLVT